MYEGFKTHKGFFRPQNPDKYAGNSNNIIYRSGWELKLMKRFDIDPNIIYWASEEIVVPYTDRASGKLRRYYPDFVIKKKDPTTGEVQTIMIEVKPFSQANPPVKGNKKQSTYLRECKTFATNFSKWEFAVRWCASKGWKFQIITEKELGI